MSLLRTISILFGVILLGLLNHPALAQDLTLRLSQKTAVADVERRADELKAVNQAIWRFAEIGLQEKKSSALLVDKLTSAGFQVKTGISGMPTAFVASYGSSIGEKGTLYAAKTLAVTTLDLLEDPRLIVAARAAWQARMKDRKYFSFIPKGQPVPKKIR